MFYTNGPSSYILVLYICITPIWFFVSLQIQLLQKLLTVNEKYDSLRIMWLKLAQL